ncbi:winged helix-turn-helix transcriptional regulator [Trinickia mobilis]|uniref:winged helix-turn-helix transcriptional regulator n=1 Tax=Trinickia mobilis TaxID=2816356 RepID=UPI001A8E5C74|nr:helix-turn-helix domain-containing protein [Trinickia mobilis]
MKRKSFEDMECPIARTLERVGEWWSILILRDAVRGSTRFDEFERNLGISPNILSRRLATLVENGFLEKRLYSVTPPRMEYLLTERGKAFRSVLFALTAFGNDHFADDGVALQVVNKRTGRPAKLVVVDARTGKPATGPNFELAPGPAASNAIRGKFGA